MAAAAMDEYSFALTGSSYSWFWFLRLACSTLRNKTRLSTARSPSLQLSTRALPSSRSLTPRPRHHCIIPPSSLTHNGYGYLHASIFTYPALPCLTYGPGTWRTSPPCAQPNRIAPHAPHSSTHSRSSYHPYSFVHQYHTRTSIRMDEIHSDARA